MSNFSLILPNDFDEYAWEVEAKGWFSDVAVIVADKAYKLNFYDPVMSQKRQISKGQRQMGSDTIILRTILYKSAPPSSHPSHYRSQF